LLKATVRMISPADIGKPLLRYAPFRRDGELVVPA
jgi:hypothetical protein